MATSTATRSTTDYKQFAFLIDNRQTTKTHINKLKLAIKENPTILEVQPILVNEKMEIIDGQHRFVAASELGLPIHYNQVAGLNINTAREMNVLQRKWGIDDYAISYAKAGNEHYKKFNDYRRAYPTATLGLLMHVLGGTSEGGRANAAFREGKFTVSRTDEEIKYLLGCFDEVRDITSGEIPFSRAFVVALTSAIEEHDDFDYEEFKKNLQRKPDMFHRTGTVRDALRMVEDIYNFQKHVNLIRLY